MFLLNEVLVFAPGRRQEALDRLGWIHGLMATKPGFTGAIVAKYLGDGLRHTILRSWESADAYRSFREGPDGNYGRGRPAGLYANETVTPQWHGVLDWYGASAGRFLVKVQRDVPSTAWEAFSDYQTQLRQFLSTTPGVGAVQAYRATDRDESLLITRFQDRDCFECLVDSSEFTALAAVVPAGVVRRTMECFEVVGQQAPAL